MADRFNPSDPEQTLVTGSFDLPGDPAPPPLPAQHTTIVSRTEPLGTAAGVPVADQPTRTDPSLVVPLARPRTGAPRRPTPRRTTGKPRKSSKTSTAETRRWQGAPEEYQSVDLIDAFRAAGARGGARFSQRLVNLTVFASIVIIMFFAHWAGRPTLTVTEPNVVEMEEAEPTEVVAAPTAPAEVAEAVTVPSVPAAAVVPDAATQTPSAAAPTPATPSATAPTTTEMPTVATTAPEAEAATPAVGPPATPPQTQAQPLSAGAVVATAPTVAPAMDAAPPATTTVPAAPVAQEPVVASPTPAPTAQESEPADDEGGVDVVQATPPATKTVAAKSATKKGRTPVATTKSKVPTGALPELRGTIPYNSGGPSDLDHPSVREAYHQLNRAVVSRTPGMPRKLQTPTPPKEGIGKTVEDLDGAYQRQFILAR